MSDPQNPSDAIDDIYTDPAPIVEFVKMQIDFWQKVVILDAATFAASFTATGIFREHINGDGGVGYLAAAWKLLLWGAALCLLAQWIAVPAAIATSSYRYGMRVLTLINRLGTQALALGERIEPRFLNISSEIMQQTPKLQSRAN